MTLDLVLPVPPPLNHYYYHHGVQLVISEEGRAYREMVKRHLRPLLGTDTRHQPMPYFAEEDVAVEIAWYRAKRQGDVDGRLKVVLDALQKLAYTNDRQIAHLSIWRHDQPFDGEPRIEVQVRAYDPHS